jgi:hypothetical protein
VTGHPGVPETPPERVNFFQGQLLTADDLRADQDYHRAMRYLHNRVLHGPGVAEGFAVEADESGLSVAPGLAIDPLGRELVLTSPEHLDLPPGAAVEERTVWHVVATWEEAPSRPTADGGPPFSRWVERCALAISRAVPDDAGPALLLATVVAGAGVVAAIEPAGPTS